MNKTSAYVITVVAVFAAIALLVSSFTVRAIAALLIVLAAVAFIVRALKTSRENVPVGATPEPDKADTFTRDKLFNATIQGMREGLLIVDNDMRVVASNQAAYRLFNSPRAKLEAQRLTELTRNPAIYAAFHDGLQGKQSSDVRVETHGADRLAFDLRVVPLGAANGKGAEGALGIFTDVTRTERLEQVRQEFLSNVSHELRTPLTAILAFIETLESGALDDPEASRRFLSIIRRNATRMQDLIADILELSAIESGRVTVNAAPVELHPIVNDVIASLTANARERNIAIENHVPPDTKVIADARRLEQMLTNLVENAIKFNRDHGTVSISFNQAREASARIIVTDTGEGIPAQHVDRIFERFYRVDRARSRELGGMGLGLAIVKHLARAHGGEVTVSSEIGKGSAFMIELPAHARVSTGD